MDAVKIGNTIKELRKSVDMTQLQFAEKLNVTDKAVSKWELGQSIPDLQQLEAITSMFNISYDDLLNGNLSAVKPSKPNDTKQKIRKKFDSKEWYSLDNAAKIYPPMAGKDWNAVFRIAAVMKERVDMPILNQALADMMDRFPTIMVTLKKGLFWYYFNRVESSPEAVYGGNHPCTFIPLDNNKYLFRVSVENNRIACDFFHSLTDGTGGSIFLNTLLTRYYELKYGEVKDHKGAMNVLDRVHNEELDDSFARYCQSGSYAKRETKTAYQIKSRKVKANTVTHLVMDGGELKDISHKYGCTITVFLTAVLIRSLMQRRAYDGDKRPIIVQIPINLRKHFPSETLRNFALFTGIEVDAKELALEEIIQLTSEQLKAGLDKNALQQNINANMREEKNLAIRLVPLPLKNIALGIVGNILGDRGFSSTFSNVGVMSCPEELNAIVDRMEFVLKESAMGGVVMSAITFNNKCTLSFTRNIVDSAVEREFVRALTAMGLNIYAESNGGDLE